MTSTKLNCTELPATGQDRKFIALLTNMKVYILRRRRRFPSANFISACQGCGARGAAAAAELCNGKINAELTHWLFRRTLDSFLSDPVGCLESSYCLDHGFMIFDNAEF